MSGFSFNFSTSSSSSSNPTGSIVAATSPGFISTLSSNPPEFQFTSTLPTDSTGVKASSQIQQEKPQQASAQSNGADDNKQKTSKSPELEKLVQVKTTENNGSRIEEGKNKSDSSPMENAGKSDKFTYTRILRGVTHNPHFTPLQSYSKRAREKMIVGWDELFEETIDNIQSLTAKTFSANVDELCKTIAELENLGYNVARLKKRLDELTDVMDKRDSSEREMSDLKAKAENYKKEKKKLETDIAGLQAQANHAQVMMDELMDRVDKMEGNLPTIDALFENLAMNPL